jgi:hypothetical protein
MSSAVIRTLPPHVANASLDDVADVEGGSDRTRFDGLPAIAEGGVPREHAKQR